MLTREGALAAAGSDKLIEGRKGWGQRMPLLALIRTGQLTGPPPKIEVSLSDKRENNEPGGGYRVIAGGKVLQQQATRCRLSLSRARSQPPNKSRFGAQLL